MPPAATSIQVPVIEMRNVSAASLFAPQSAVVEGVNWTVQPGDFWAIAGLQGTGKTDFLSMTGGISAPLAGDYRLFGEPMPIFDEARLGERLRAGLVFEGGQLFHHLTMRENIALPIRYHRNLGASAVREEVDEWLDALELGPWADSTPSAVSRVWQRRVGLARALVLRPELLLLDSPIAGMDLLQLGWWLRLLWELSVGHRLIGRPITLVVTTADMGPWQDVARQFAVIRDHRFHVLGNWEQAQAARGEPLRGFFAGLEDGDSTD